MDEDLMLKTAVKAMNDTMGLQGLVPNMLVFGIMPPYSPVGLHGTLPDQQSRLRFIHTERQEYFKSLTACRYLVLCASKSRRLPTAYNSVGDTVHAYFEDNKAYSEPRTILEVSENNRMVKIDTGNGLQQLYPTRQIKPYKKPKNEASEFVRKVSYGLWLRDYVRPTFDVNFIEVIDAWDPRAESPI